MTRRTGETSAPAAGSPASSTGATQSGSPAATTKLPIRVAVLYGKALDAKDKGKKSDALELFGAILKEFPDYPPAKAEAAKLKGT